MSARSARAPAAAPEADRVQLGLRLREHRKARRLTLKDLSGHSGVALSTLSKMELGQISVSYEKLAAVARALSLDVGQLLDARAAAPAGAPAPVVVWSEADGASAYSSGNYDFTNQAAGTSCRFSSRIRDTVSKNSDSGPAASKYSAARSSGTDAANGRNSSR